MSQNEFKAEERPLTQGLKTYEDAYVKQRYKEIHDYLHVLLDQTDVSILNELRVKVFELSNLGLPSAFFASTVGTLLIPKEQKLELLKDFPRLIKLGLQSPNMLSIYFEEHFDKDIKSFRKQLKIQLDL
jgi:ubiquinone biosynthesis protein COQ4